ncbi:Uncharacterized conserved protein, DUF58 family, contains vWF domain [Streptomyces sp. TLI_053]|uniref:DUF58 domain-containing protein n=1 Tax=Streptomyces sp. TLI_053 TaxID=1855352 RepID=UPI00087A406E|nr:DUF58 domain-containing protein [Streptomyces sp. TLI_053]SDS66295.1 Uncharacterized conserved protein, DUF58 family, contains vWF domain [Streptomyces sp. TLI_053]
MSPEPAAGQRRGGRAGRLAAQSAALGTRPVRRLAGPAAGPAPRPAQKRPARTAGPTGAGSDARTDAGPGRRTGRRTGPAGPERASARLVARSARATLAGLPTAPPSPYWRPGERTLRLLTVATVAAVAALITGHPWLLALAAGPAVLLALAAPGNDRPSRLDAGNTVTPRRCLEGEPITVRITVRHDGRIGRLDPAASLGPGVTLTAVTVGTSEVDLVVRAERWGRWTLGSVDIDVYDAGGLARRTVRTDLGTVDVFPEPSAARLTPIPVRLPERLGEHTTTHEGTGVEVVGVRPYVPGERQRRIHWPSTTRRDAVQINQFAAERATDAVVLLDTLADFRDAATGRSSLDETLRAATGLTRAYLRRHDRVGLIAVGGKLRWLTAGSGERQSYRMVESVLEVRQDRGHRGLLAPRLPVAALPRHALVYAFTSLADQRILDVLGRVRDLGNPLVVVEIPAGEPAVEPGDEIDAVALRLWRAEREAMRSALRARGVPVARYTPGEALDLALAPLLRRRIGGGTR